MEEGPGHEAEKSIEERILVYKKILGADYADYTDSFVSRKLHLEYSYLNCNPCNPRNPRLKNRSIEPYLHYSAS